MYFYGLIFFVLGINFKLHVFKVFFSLKSLRVLVLKFSFMFPIFRS